MLTKPILVTGSRGLIGKSIIQRLRTRGAKIREFDIAEDAASDLCNSLAIANALQDIRGVLHLGGVSRVLWGEKDPETCILANTGATKSILDGCLADPKRPWVIYASSREVYGQSEVLPVDEDFQLHPMNTYAKSKVRSEAYCQAAAREGLLVNIVRFSSVYGIATDHPDRVAPAFARAAALGGAIRLEGKDNTLDFTYIDDVVEGLYRLVSLTEDRQQLPPVHLVSGRGVRLEELAQLAQKAADHDIEVYEDPPRNYDVSRFIGSPRRALELLGWKATTPIEDGFLSLIQKIKAM
ncbi:NAD-dependent epimerase/dehydratase family protein [Notoacmeibacter marinus]|uniref:NAD-dependent epimerase/dehydratase family protein n=1 Tax=Notoacmeibacter marinus TaxID=1876515 RepID=UPI000DF2EF13|nr:NAD(P)-dependent oxidoreductase [Notoacmeibacter marinus]